MKDGRTSALVLLLALSLTACGGGTPGPSAGAPELLAISPPNGAVGVHKDTNIELSFNQPMNHASVEAAYVSFSEGLRRDQVTFVWNANSTKVTIDPKVDLKYADGTAAPITYSFLVGSSAADQAGGTLKETVASFRTARQFTAVLGSQAALDGYTSGRDALYSNGVVGGNTARTGGMGDMVPEGGSATVSVRAFFSFDLSGLPPTVVPGDLSAATLGLEQVTVYPSSAYADMTTAGEQLILEQVNYGNQLTITDFGTPALSLVTAAFSKDAALTRRSADVLTQVRDDLANRAARGDRTQYRLRFAKDQPEGSYGFADFATAEGGARAPSLELKYLAP
ncbi:Ig-like domain-containing protein [Deinococcus sp. KSM4-11]|uniref:Ig-like domain-containing protein n=1 Tax=Deinococcus sp. KSM4-11 TaxID=2568654 RepID=UPI001454CEAA|nr:Ig-like domain-containing protein [Deinococcus sp. KSM4-11]